MNSNNLYFVNRLVTAIKLGFLIHDSVVFKRKRKKYSLSTYSNSI